MRACASSQKQLLMDAIAITIFTYGPVDRVGVIRKLRVGETLVKGADGAWSVDLTKAMRAHKSAKYHGGTKHALPKPVWPLIDRLCQLTQYDLLYYSSQEDAMPRGVLPLECILGVEPGRRTRPHARPRVPPHTSPAKGASSPSNAPPTRRPSRWW